MACLFCGGQALEPLYEGIRDHYGVDVETHRFLRCADCGSAMLHPLPSPSRLAALYSADYTFKPAPAHSALRRLLQAIEWKCFYEPGYRRRLAILRRLTGLHGGRVLEVGCGSGLFLRFLEKAGYDVTYSTDIDTHSNGTELLHHKAFLSVGHDEYWSKEMRDAVETARDAGVHLAFFGANASYTQVRFESSAAGVPTIESRRWSM